MESLFNLSSPSVQNNSIFGSILTSFFPNDESPGVSMRHPFGLSTTRTFSANLSILSFPIALSPLIIDGVHNVPVQFSALFGFSALSPEARTIISVAIYKTSNEEFTNALSGLWKGVGVRPIPDTRWARYRGVFALGQARTGIEEIDRYVATANAVLNESMSFIKHESLQRLLRPLTEAELRWSWIFVNAYGVDMNGHKAIVAPLIFARRSFNSSRAASVKTVGGLLTVVSPRKLERGEEVFLDASADATDAFAFLFHGSWVSDDSVHRGKVWLRLVGDVNHDVKQGCVESDGTTAVLLSTDTSQLHAARDWLRECVRISVNSSMDRMSPAKELRAVSTLIKAFEEELKRLQKHTSSDSALEAVRFQYFNLLYTEFVFWSEQRERLLATSVDV